MITNQFELTSQVRSFHAVKSILPPYTPEVKTGRNQPTDALGSRDRATLGLLGQQSAERVMERADDAEGPDKERLVRALDHVLSHEANRRAARDLSRRSPFRFGCKQSFYQKRLVIDGGYTCFGDQECHHFAKTTKT